MKKSKVIIVGGGVAGLSAAYELSSIEGFDICLIEKNKRLGGRINSNCFFSKAFLKTQIILVKGYKRIFFQACKKYSIFFDRL